MIYPEFDKYTPYVDKENPFCNAYTTKEGHLFFVEPWFYVGLSGFKEKRAERFEEIMKAIDDIVTKNEKVIFTGDFDSPFIVRDGFIYREIHDITDPLQIDVEDKSRGSDYGD